MMRERVHVGRTSCDFMSREEFYALCANILQGDEFHHIVTLNPEMVVEAENNAAFRTAVNGASYRVPDGSGLFWARLYLMDNISLLRSIGAFMRSGDQCIKGVDIVHELTRIAARDTLSVYLLGGTRAQARGTAHMLSQTFPGAVIHTSEEHAFSLDGPRAILNDINHVRPDILLVAYGAPHQALWIHRHRASLPSVRIAVGVGGAFAFLSNDVYRAPRILQRIHLEWFWRVLMQPWRAPRIIRAVVHFPWLVIKQKRTV